MTAHRVVREIIRVALDTVIYNRAIEYPDFGDHLRRACQEGHIKLVSTHVQRGQLEATPDPTKRYELLSFFDSVSGGLTPTSAAVWDVSKWDQAEWPTDERIELFTRVLGETSPANSRHAKDALLAVTAFAKADMFVTADAGLLRRTRKAVLECGSKLSVLEYREFAVELAGF